MTEEEARAQLERMVEEIQKEPPGYYVKRAVDIVQDEARVNELVKDLWAIMVANHYHPTNHQVEGELNDIESAISLVLSNLVNARCRAKMLEGGKSN